MPASPYTEVTEWWFTVLGEQFAISEFEEDDHADCRDEEKSCEFTVAVDSKGRWKITMGRQSLAHVHGDDFPPAVEAFFNKKGLPA